MKAGVFDSGVGGLTVVKSLLEENIFEEIIYFGDTARVPYGVKDKNTIIRYSLEAAEFFKNFDIDIMITACNSVSAYAIEELREVSSFEVIGVIEPGVLALQKKVKNIDDNILILGTRATISSNKYSLLLKEKGFKNLTSISPSLFVPIVEEGLFGSKILQETMNHYFQELKESPKAIILGCTHFPLIKDEIREYFPNSTIIHSGEAIVEYLKDNFELNHSFDKTKIKFFASENPDSLKKIASLWLGLCIN